MVRGGHSNESASLMFLGESMMASGPEADDGPRLWAAGRLTRNPSSLDCGIGTSYSAFATILAHAVVTVVYAQ